jgi:hypothetical protein
VTGRMGALAGGTGAYRYTETGQKIDNLVITVAP